MNVQLTPSLEKLVQAKVKSGRYGSASEVVREALRLMEERDETRGIQLAELRNRIDQGIADAEHGRTTDGEAFMRGMIKSIHTKRSKRKPG